MTLPRTIALAVATAGVLAGCDPARPGRRAPPFVLPDLKGQPVSLASCAGHPVVIAFWASWAAPSRMAWPRWVRLQRTWGSRGVRVLTIAVEDDPAAVTRLARDHPNGLAVLLGDAATVERYFGRGDVALPTELVVDGRGVIVRRTVGLGAAGETDAALAAALGEGNGRMASSTLTGGTNP